MFVCKNKNSVPSEAYHSNGRFWGQSGRGGAAGQRDLVGICFSFSGNDEPDVYLCEYAVRP